MDNKKRNVYFCVYSNEKYEKPRKALIELAKKSKIFSGIFEYDREWLEKTVFYKDNIEILGDTKGKGDGWCLWKPYVILESLNKIKEGDVIFYMDSTDTFSPNIGNFLDDYFNNNNLLLSLLGLSPNKHYTKRDTFFYMGCDSRRYWDSLQLEAGIIGVKKNKKNMQIISEYLGFCRNPNIINNSNNVCGLENLQGYIDHRYDQSVLTNIKTKYNINPSREIRKYVECNMWEALKYWDNNNTEFKRKVDIMKEKCGDEYILWKENYLDHIIN